MANKFKEYPKCLYHRRLAPEGKVFQTAEEAEGLAAAGWVDTPAKFPKRSELSLSELREDFAAAEEQYRHCTTTGACLPGSDRWEQVTAAYNAARDSYQFALREAELAAGKQNSAGRVARGLVQTFETAFSTFTVKGVVGEGANGTVFHVLDEDGKEWAIKCLKPNALTGQKIKRFKNETAFCAKARHQNIITVLDWGLAEISSVRVPFYVMPRFPSTLRKQMQAGIPRHDVLRWFDQLLAGLEAAHAVGVWHRDLKPENLLCGEHLVITDFGMAHYSEPLLQTAVETLPHERLANFQYAAPEQRALGRTIDHRADIYACGLILNEMFTGEILQGTGHKKIESVAPEFAYLDVVVDRMVRQSPSERPASIVEIRAELGFGAAAASATAKPE